MKNQEIKEKIAEGHILVRSIIEIVGKPKDHIESALKDYLKKLNEQYVVTNEHFENAVPKENFFSTFAEIEILMKDTNDILSFAFDYMPASIEILEPENLVIKNNNMTGFINDLLARLHALNTAHIAAKDNIRFYVKNTAVLLRNFLIVLISSRPMDLKEIQPFMGVKEQDIKKVLDILIKEGKVEKANDKYKAIIKK